MEIFPNVIPNSYFPAHWYCIARWIQKKYRGISSVPIQIKLSTVTTITITAPILTTSLLNHLFTKATVYRFPTLDFHVITVSYKHTDHLCIISPFCIQLLLCFRWRCRCSNCEGTNSPTNPARPCLGEFLQAGLVADPTDSSSGVHHHLYSHPGRTGLLF